MYIQFFVIVFFSSPKISALRYVNNPVCWKWGCLNNEVKYVSGNVKALFRRGKAHIGLWNPEEAKADFDMALKLDRKLQKVIREQLSILKDLQAERDREDRQKLAGKLIT